MNANRVVIVSILLSFFVSGVVSADERDQFNQIRALLSQRKLDEADEQLAAALETHPDSSRLRSLHYSFYVYLNRADRPLDAARHAEANVDVRLGNLKRSPRTASSFAQQLGYVTSAYLKAEQADVAFEKHAEAINKVKELLEERESAELATLIVDLRARKALLLQAAGEEEKARELLDEVQSEAAMAFKKAPESTVAVLTLARVLGVRAELEPAGDAQLGATQEQLKLLAEQARQHSSDDALVTAYYDAAMLGLYSLMRTDAIAAEKELATLREFLASLPTGRGGSIASLVTSSKRTLSSIERRIGSAKAQQALLGEPAFALEAEAWVNGSPLSDGDLQGKVVLLDFWAVWCGPCVATFPHLREWNEKYAGKGLVIIGATRYYSYDWDEQAKRSKKTADLSPAAEQVALAAFAKHHELSHRFMVMPKESQFSKNYGVSGIPQAVLIDRAGKVRMIRVGSGEANAHDLEGMIETLLEGAATDSATKGG